MTGAAVVSRSRWWLWEAALGLAVTTALTACASSSTTRPRAMSQVQDPQCAALSDSVSKYVSGDALPVAHLEGSPRILPVPASMRPGDSVVVDFVVRPDGVADTASMVIIGPSDPQFAKSALQFAAESQFTPARVSNCYILSRYNLVVKAKPRG